MISTWKVLDRLEDLDQLIADSFQTPVIFFKHSTRCGVSLHAMHKLESAWDINEGEADFYYLDLLQHRDISNEIARRLGVVHQSPQVIVIKNGEVKFHTSHQAIDVASLHKVL